MTPEDRKHLRALKDARTTPPEDNKMERLSKARQKAREAAAAAQEGDDASEPSNEAEDALTSASEGDGNFDVDESVTISDEEAAATREGYAQNSPYAGEVPPSPVAD